MSILTNLPTHRKRLLAVLAGVAALAIAAAIVIPLTTGGDEAEQAAEQAAEPSEPAGRDGPGEGSSEGGTEGSGREEQEGRQGEPNGGGPSPDPRARDGGGEREDAAALLLRALLGGRERAGAGQDEAFEGGGFLGVEGNERDREAERAFLELLEEER
jgi:hypothetical protein